MDEVTPQPRQVILRDFGEAGLAIEFKDNDLQQPYTADSYDALVIVYRDKQGKISDIEIEFEDTDDVIEEKLNDKVVKKVKELEDLLNKALAELPNKDEILKRAKELSDLLHSEFEKEKKAKPYIMSPFDVWLEKKLKEDKGVTAQRHMLYYLLQVVRNG